MLTDMLQVLTDNIGERDRTLLLRLLNRAYKELYDTYDLPNAVVDEIFEVDGQDGQIVLPEYVDQIRGAGARMNYVPLTIADFRSGYRVTPNFQQPFEWRVRGVVALSAQMDVTDQLRVTLSQADTQTVNVYITGETAGTSQYTETVTFTPGETTKLTTAQFIGDNPYAITQVAKDVRTAGDVVVNTQSDLREISRIRNRLLRAQYTLIQLTNLDQPVVFLPPNNGASIVYKKALVPLENDTDEICYPRAEECVVQKACELYYASGKDKDDVTARQMAFNKCLTLLNTIMVNQESQSEMRINFGRNRYSAAWAYGNRRGNRLFSYGYYR